MSLAEATEEGHRIKDHSPTHAVSPDYEFDYDLSRAPKNRLLFILTVYGVTMKGSFTGVVEKDRDIMAWCPLPCRNHELEAKLKKEGKLPWTSLAMP